MVAREHPAGRTSELTFTPRLANDPACRFRWRITRSDLEAFDAIPRDSKRSVVITELEHGTRWRVRPADCGFDCYCDAEAIPIENPHGFESR